jgi:hypothetical protein
MNCTRAIHRNEPEGPEKIDGLRGTQHHPERPEFLEKKKCTARSSPAPIASSTRVEARRHSRAPHSGLQFDKRTKEYIGPIYPDPLPLIPNLWYRRHKGFLGRVDI